MSTMKYFLADDDNNKSRLHQLDLIGSFLQANGKHIFFWSWKVDMDNTSQSMPTILEDHWGEINKYMEW